MQNTSNYTRVIRDVSLHLYNGNTFVEKFLQMDELHSEIKHGDVVKDKKDVYYGNEKGSYSVVLAPSSIQRQHCEYCIRIQDDTDWEFDNIRLTYFDEINKKRNI